MQRTPPIEVRRQLRREVGFGCPIPGCGNPYLRWHHFDPPWRDEKHHRPAGMIALCAEHHAKADAGAYSREQLHEFKRAARKGNKQIEGRFDWLRRDLLMVVGGNFFHNTPVAIEAKGKPIIWFTRDDAAHLLVNVRMITVSGQPRCRIEESYWISPSLPEDLECPPSGKILRVSYANGDYLAIEFFEMQSAEDLVLRYPMASPRGWPLSFPITAVEIAETVGGTEYRFDSSSLCLPRGNVVRACFFEGCRAGISIS
ncbi:MAG: HNH endonuclease [Dehalococcoidia bacterium]|nr:HNH endonuclease [Dehalococcoidia bacterium]